MKLYDSTEAARLTGRERVTVNRLARVYGIGIKKGRDWIFTDEDLERIRAINPLGGKPPASGKPIEYKADPKAVKKGRPKKKPSP